MTNNEYFIAYIIILYNLNIKNLRLLDFSSRRLFYYNTVLIMASVSKSIDLTELDLFPVMEL